MNSKIVPIQQKLLGIIHDQIPDKYSYVDELSELLHISSDSVYRRLRGETLLSITEIQDLCLHYNISFDSVCGLENTGLVSFQYDPVKGAENFINYLTSMRDVLKNLEQKGDAHIIYAAIDIPILHNFRFPLVSFFKSFYWLKSISNFPGYREVKFSRGILNTEFVELGKEINELYCKIPSTEIWTDLILNALLRQVDYYWDSGEFSSREDALELLEEVEKEFDYMLAAAQACSKNPGMKALSDKPGNFEVYLCDIEISNNCILIQDGAHKSAILGTHTYNKMATSNLVFTEETQHWMDSLLTKSTLISCIGEKQRSMFFRNAQDKITQLKQKIRSN
jgi:hypothetical protein